MISGVPGTPEQHAGVLLSTVKARGLPQTAAVIVLMTGLTESGLRVLANTGDPVSQQLPHDGVGWDHDSVGIFQQRPQYWGTTEACMDPATSCGLFLDRLTAFDWASRLPWHASQDVQVSAYDGTPRAANNYSAEYGGNYHAQYPTALALCARLWGLGQSMHVTEEDDDMPLITITQTTHPTTGNLRWFAISPRHVREVTKSQAAAVLAMTGGKLVTASEVAAAAGNPVIASILS